jgi:hypothetical protein
LQKIFFLDAFCLLLLSTSCASSIALQPTAVSAANDSEPIYEISASHSWQGTNIRLRSGETFQIQFISGEIQDGEAIIRGPSGAGWACEATDCCEPMPFEQRDALIGRVSDKFFVVRDQNEITSPADGELQLRINDCNAGLFDNSGSFKIRISHSL